MVIKRAKAPCTLTNNILLACAMGVHVCVKKWRNGMEKIKKVLVQLIFWIAIGVAIKMLWNNTLTKRTAVAEKSVEATSATNPEIVRKSVKMQVRPNLGQAPAK